MGVGQLRVSRELCFAELCLKFLLVVRGEGLTESIDPKLFNLFPQISEIFGSQEGKSHNDSPQSSESLPDLSKSFIGSLTTYIETIDSYLADKLIGNFPLRF